MRADAREGNGLCLRHRQQPLDQPHMGTAFRPAKTSLASWDAFSDVEAFVDAVLAERRGLCRRERREVGGQAALAKSAMGLTSASNSGSKPDPSLPLRTAQRTWSRRSAPLRDHRICWDLFMRRLTRKLAVPSVIDVPTRRPAR